MKKFVLGLKKFETLLKKEMGIKNIKKEQVNLNLKEVELSELEIELNTKGRDVSIRDVDIADDKTLEYQGKKVVLYMRDQYHPTEKKYKYHVAWCDHLEEMDSRGKIKRYVVNNRKDGIFVINVFSSQYRDSLIQEEVETRMEVCVKCLAKLNYKGFVFNPLTYRKAVNCFNLEEFFEEYKPQWEKGMNLKSNRLQPINTYSKNWREISKKYREYMGWMCEKCGKDCSQTRGDLEVHHKNRNKFDSSMKNLEALCSKCHKELHELEDWT